MKILYTLSALVALTGYSYRNPQHFLRPERDATEVLIDGDYPNINKAYGDLGINVSQYVAEMNTNQSSGDGEGNIKPPKQKELTVEQIKALLTEKGIHFDTKANKPELLKLLEDFQNSGDGEGDSNGDNENTGSGEGKGTGEGANA